MIALKMAPGTFYHDAFRSLIEFLQNRQSRPQSEFVAVPLLWDASGLSVILLAITPFCAG